MIRKKILTILAVVLFVGTGLYAVPVDKIFTSDGVIREGDEYARVFIYDTPPHRTTVSMFGGSTSGITTYDSSILNMAGGRTEMTALNQSTINISGGRVTTLAAFDSSNVNVFGGSAYSITAYDTATVNIWGNAIVDILFPEDSGVINMSGGVVDRTGSGEFGTLNLSGGLVREELWAGDSGIINVYGYNLAKFPTGGNYGFGFVSGEWADRTAFNIDLSGTDTYSRVILYQIPEPATALLIAIGGVYLRKRRAF